MEQQIKKNHNVTITHRTEMNLSGIDRVVSLEPELVELETAEDHLAIKGQELHAEKLDMERGELRLSGTIQGMLYSEKKGKKKAAAIAKRLFR